MSKLPRISGEDVKNALLRGGFVLSHIRGSHHYLVNHGKSFLVCVPVHGNRILPIKTLQSILRQARLSVEAFMDLLQRQALLSGYEVVNKLNNGGFSS